MKKLICVDRVTDNLLSNLESRDAALWIQSLPKHTRLSRI